MESIAGISSVRQLFVKILYLNYSWNLVFFTYSDSVLITPGSSNEFPWIPIWPLVQPHADCCVDIGYSMHVTRWLRPVFAESYRCYVWIRRKNLWLFVFEMHLIIASKLHCREELCVLHHTRCVRLAALSYNKNIVASEQYCSFVRASIT